MDVYAAQQMFGRGRTFDRIDLALAPGHHACRRRARSCRRSSAPEFDVQPPASRGRQAEAMVAGYTMMVNISSVFALFIGMFIIYNSFATSVTAAARRDRHPARARRHARPRSAASFSAKAWCSGLLGSLVGLVAGRPHRAGHRVGDQRLGRRAVRRRASRPPTSRPIRSCSAWRSRSASLTSVVAAAIPARQRAHASTRSGTQERQLSDPVGARRAASESALAVRPRRRARSAVRSPASPGCFSIAGYACTIAAGAAPRTRC